MAYVAAPLEPSTSVQDGHENSHHGCKQSSGDSSLSRHRAHAEPAISVSVYDLDRTLTRHGTYLRFLIFAARKTSPWRLLRLPEVVAAMAAYKLKVFNRIRLKEIMQERLLGAAVHAATLAPIAEAFAQKTISGGCHAEVVARLEEERAQVLVIVIATAAQRLHAGPIAQQLGVEHLIATEGRRDGDWILARVDGPNRRGASKMEAVDAWLHAHPELSEAGFRFYSDDYSDLPVFEQAAECIAVHPSRKLRRVAKAKGWEVLE